MKCAYARCGRRFTPKRAGQVYCRAACRVADWRIRHRRAAPALSKAFDLIGVEIEATDVAVIVEKVALQCLEGWLRAWVGFNWNGRDFEDTLEAG